MHNVTRPGGTQYTVSTMVTYCAIGWVEPGRRAHVVGLLRRFLTGLQGGASPEQAAAVVGLPRPEAIQAASLIREFDSVIGRSSDPVVEENVRTPSRADNIGVFARGPFRMEEAAEVGDRTARALASLLVALGATDVFGANVD